MSAEATIYVWKLKKITPRQKLLLLSLADVADSENYAILDTAHISSSTCLHPGLVDNLIGDMVGKNLIEAMGISSGRKKYKILGMIEKNKPVPPKSSSLINSLWRTPNEMV